MKQMKAAASFLVIVCCLAFTVEGSNADDVIKLSMSRTELNKLATKRMALRRREWVMV